MRNLTPCFMRYAGQEWQLGDQHAGENAQTTQDDSNNGTPRHDRKLDPVKAAMDKVQAQLLSHDPKAALDLLREMRDHQTFDGGKLKLSPQHLQNIEYQMQDLVVQLNPNDPTMQMAMYKALKLDAPGLAPAVAAPAPSMVLHPAQTFATAAPSPRFAA